MLHNLKHNQVLHEANVIMTWSSRRPWCRRTERVELSS